MKVSISEIRKDKVFLFLAPDATHDELQDFGMKVQAWMSSHYEGLPCSFYLHTTDGRLAIVSILDVNNGWDGQQVEEVWD